MSNDIELAKEAVLNLFKNYSIEDELVFGEITDVGAFNKDEIYDYTGFIGVSGGFGGFISLTCRFDFLEFLYERLTDELPKQSIEKYFSDLIGELANTLAGYFQKEYGDSFLISVPVIVVGGQAVETIKKRWSVSSKAFSIPFHYNDLESILVVSAFPRVS